MSYILDALRKAERDRQVARVPTLAAAHGSAELARRLHWGWLVATGAVSLSAIILYGLLLAPGRPGTVAPVPVAAGPVTAASDPAAKVGAEPAASAPSLDRAPAPVEPAPARAPEPAVERPPAGRATGRGRSAAAAPTVEAPPSVRSAVEPPRAREKSQAAEAVVPERAAVAPAPPPAVAPAPPPAVAPGSPPAVAPGSPPAVAKGPVPEPRPAPAVAPPLAVAAGRPAPPAPPAVAASGDAQGRFALDVLVYSEVAAERLVFINGRKYVEGQAVDGDTVLEQIRPDGAVLLQQGRQIVLRPKLNPYTSPGSP